MNLLLSLFFSLVWSENLGIRYDDVVSKWINYERRRMMDRALGIAPSTFTIEDGMPKSSKYLGARTVWSPLYMLENDFEGTPDKGILERIGEDGEERYLVEGYETPIDAPGVNYLCLSTAIKPVRISIEGITNVAIGYRGYFNESQARQLGECVSGILNGMEVWAVPEPLCGLVSKVEHVGEDTSFHCMVITTSGRKTVFAFYRVDVKDKKRIFENLFYVDSAMISDWEMQRIIYSYIETRLGEYISDKSDISDTSRNVTFYPRTKDSAVFDLKIDMRSVYREISKALRYKNVVDSVKIVEGVNVVDSEENTRFVIEAPVFDIGEIQRRFEAFVKSREDEIGRVIEEVKRKTGGESGYSVMMRSEFYGNPILDRVFGFFEKKDYMRAEDIEKGAAKIMRSTYTAVDPKVLRVSGKSRSGEAYMEEVRLKREMREILEKKKRKMLRDIFREVSDLCTEEDEELFGDISKLDGIRRAVNRWRELEARDIEVREERRLREQALKDLKEAIISTEKLGKSNDEVWNEGLKNEVSNAVVKLEIMSSDDKYKKKDIEEVEFDLIVKSKNLFNAHEERIRKEKEAKERENEKKERGPIEEKHPEEHHELAEEDKAEL
ncbi:hypothetical protein M970_071390 [Encephalitozoon cuniculi EcunIII-L]|nr:hypothetical protein M970_071390 [Encephalitozoon cuniculi EcunIII-L]